MNLDNEQTTFFVLHTGTHKFGNVHSNFSRNGQNFGIQFCQLSTHLFQIS